MPQRTVYTLISPSRLWTNSADSRGFRLRIGFFFKDLLRDMFGKMGRDNVGAS